MHDADTAVGVVGAGRMGGALIQGWMEAGLSPADLVIVDPTPGEAARRALDDGATAVPTRLVDCATVLIAVKPQRFASVAPALAVDADAMVLSIMAGVSVATLNAAFPGRAVVRAMPNTPAAVGQGITGLFAPGDVEAPRIARAERLLSVCGPVVRVESEDGIDRLTAVSGSGPAYVFHLVEALAASARKLGFAPDTALALARHTVTGAARLLEDDADPTALRAAVTSPNGTTQAALDVLMGELTELMERTTRAAYRRAVELSKRA